MSDTWWQGVPPAEATLVCGGGQHLLRWDHGQLRAPAHPDPAGERLLTALGGELPTCLELAESWERHGDDLQVLAVGGRHADEALTLTPEAVAAVSNSSRAQHLHQQRRQMRQHQFPGRWPPQALEHVDQQLEQHRRHIELLSLLTLPAPLRQRLELTVAARWAERRATGDPSVDPQLPRLEAAVAGRAWPALVAWLGRPGPVDVVLSLPGEPPAVLVEPGGMSARIGLDWLAGVWGRQLALVDGHLVLAVDDIDASSAVVQALAPGQARPTRLALVGPLPWRMA